MFEGICAAILVETDVPRRRDGVNRQYPGYANEAGWLISTGCPLRPSLLHCNMSVKAGGLMGVSRNPVLARNRKLAGIA